MRPGAVGPDRSGTLTLPGPSGILLQCCTTHIAGRHCSMSNVARRGLTEANGCPLDLLRVGPLRRIDRSLLAYSLHSTAGKRSEAAQELEAMLKEATSVSEQKVLKDELAEVSLYVVVSSSVHSYILHLHASGLWPLPSCGWRMTGQPWCR